MDHSFFWTRREFLEFMGRSALVGVSAPWVSACAPKRAGVVSKGRSLPFKPLPPTSADSFTLAEGFESKLLIAWGETINPAGDPFGYNNDYNAFVPIPMVDPMTSGLLWVNHEYPISLFVSGYEPPMKRTREQVEKERECVGGSLLRIHNRDGIWTVDRTDPLNHRWTARSRIPIVSERPIAGSRVAIGTLANCAGGVTPWNTILTCEENFQDYYGEDDTVTKLKTFRTGEEPRFGWNRFFDYPREHYGWVVEIDPFSRQARKLTSLGRFAHEGACVVETSDGRLAVYMGDDRADGSIYKFISDRRDSIETGTLYAADVEAGEWKALSWAAQPVLKAHFKDQTDVLIHARVAAELVGATPLNRPEDMERDPRSGAIIVALTNNKKKGDYYGSLLRIEEENGDHGSVRFTAKTLITGGRDNGMACPDNLVFDRRGNLWVTGDVSGYELATDPYRDFGNNALYYIPMSGADAGEVFRVASAPVDAELTGPMFLPDGVTLVVGVQHPGETSADSSRLTSHWPDGGTSTPRPAVVTVSGPAMRALVS